MIPKKIVFGILIMIVIGTSSCQKILFMALGIKPAKEETAISLKKFIAKYDLDINDIWIANDTTDFVKLNNTSASQSGYLFFNSEKRMLMYKDTGKACSAPVINFVKNICSGNQPYYYKEYHTDLLLKKIHPLCQINEQEKKYDYYAFVFWYKYLGERGFRDNVVSIVNELKKSKCNVKVYLVNLDLQPGWRNQITIKTEK